VKYPIVHLGEICEFTYGNGLKETDHQGGKIPVYGSNGIVGWHDKSLTNGETIIIGRKGSIGEIHISKTPCWPIDTTYYIEQVKTPCNFTWLYYALIGLDLTRLNKSAAVPGLNREDAYEQRLPLPSLPEQQRIAAILQQADRLRHLRRTARQLSDTYLQSVFLEMFGNDEEFEFVEFEDVLLDEPKNGLYLPSDFYGSGTPIIRIDTFYNGVLSHPETFKRVRATPRQIKEFSVDNSEILINRVNSIEYLGKCAYVQGLDEPTLFESNMMRIRINKRIASPMYITKYLTTQHTYYQILQKSKRAVNQASINQEDVKTLKILLPSLPLQEKFGTVHE
jgi:type I restriction enzyme, S subunit